MKEPWYNRTWVVVILHATAWILLFLLPFLLPNPHNKPVDVETRYLYHYIIKSTFWIALFYINISFIFRKLFIKKQYSEFVIVHVIFFILLFFADRFSTTHILQRNFDVRGFFIFNIFPYIFIMACSSAYFMILDKIKNDRVAKEKENETLKTELSFLRSQVSPHFMFNVLNNMVALARKKSDILEPSLIKLSSLLRYMLYETDEEKVPLDKEIEYLQNYIDLQKQRFGSNLQISFNHAETEHGYFIEPMLLIPFVENAFKHGTGFIKDACISIKMYTENDEMFFSVNNKFNPETKEIKDKTSGIGLANVKRRLKLLYENSHTLTINKTDNNFIVTLQLKLH
jgi:sensor histidine kinase YesM